MTCPPLSRSLPSRRHVCAARPPVCCRHAAHLPTTPLCRGWPSPSSSCRVKLEKERRERSRQSGLIRTEASEGGEDMERERRVFQLQMCEVGGSGASQNIAAPAGTTLCCGGRDSHRAGGPRDVLRTNSTTPWHPLWPHVFLTIEKVSEIHVYELNTVSRQGLKATSKAIIPS